MTPQYTISITSIEYGLERVAHLEWQNLVLPTLRVRFGGIGRAIAAQATLDTNAGARCDDFLSSDPSPKELPPQFPARPSLTPSDRA